MHGRIGGTFCTAGTSISCTSTAAVESLAVHDTAVSVHTVGRDNVQHGAVTLRGYGAHDDGRSRSAVVVLGWPGGGRGVRGDCSGGVGATVF